MSKDGARVDTDEFHKEPRNTGPQQIFGRDLAEGTRTAQRLCPKPPQIPEQHNAEEEFVDRCGVNAAVEGLSVVAADIGAGNEAVEEAHAPRNVRWNSIIPIAGDKTADPPDGI